MDKYVRPRHPLYVRIDDFVRVDDYSTGYTIGADEAAPTNDYTTVHLVTKEPGDVPAPVPLVFPNAEETQYGHQYMFLML